MKLSALMLRRHEIRPASSATGNIASVAEEEAVIRQQWDRLRADASTASERAEIDAVFARVVG
jgi:hypothetical protein